MVIAPDLPKADPSTFKYILKYLGLSGTYTETALKYLFKGTLLEIPSVFGARPLQTDHV